MLRTTALALGQRCTNNCFSYTARGASGTRFGEEASGQGKGGNTVLKRQPKVAAGHSSFQKPEEHFVLSAAEHRGLPQRGRRSAGAHAPPQGADPAGLCRQEGYRHGLAHQAGADQAWKSRREKQVGNAMTVLSRAQQHAHGGALSEEKFLPGQSSCSGFRDTRLLIRTRVTLCMVFTREPWLHCQPSRS